MVFYYSLLFKPYISFIFFSFILIFLLKKFNKNINIVFIFFLFITIRFLAIKFIILYFILFIFLNIYFLYKYKYLKYNNYKNNNKFNMLEKLFFIFFYSNILIFYNILKNTINKSKNFKFKPFVLSIIFNYLFIYIFLLSIFNVKLIYNFYNYLILESFNYNNKKLNYFDLILYYFYYYDSYTSHKNCNEIICFEYKIFFLKIKNFNDNYVWYNPSFGLLKNN